MNNIVCEKCYQKIDENLEILHTVEFLDDETRTEKLWCIDCIDEVEDGIRIRLDGISSTYRDGLLIVLN